MTFNGCKRNGWTQPSQSRSRTTFLAEQVITFSTLLMFCSTLAWGVESGSLSGATTKRAPNHKQERSLMEKAQSQGGVRVIVRFKTNLAAGKNIGTPEGLMAQQQAVTSGQNEVLDWLTDTKVDNLKRFKYTPGLAMTVDSDALAILQANDQYRVQEDIPVPPALAESVPLINTDDVWASGVDGSGQSIAILDTGVDSTHEFLDNGKIVSEACYSTTSNTYGASSVCPNGLAQQVGAGAGVNCPVNIPGCDHGTHVAGIAAGRGAAGDFDGVARGADLIAIQVFSRFDDNLTDSNLNNNNCSNNNTSSPCVLTFTSDQIRGLERVYDLRNTFDIASVNMSLGGATTYASACDTESATSDIDNLRSVQIATVIASGNGASSTGISSPACISSAVSVGNTRKNDDVYTHTVWGSNSAPILDLLAPGTSIRSSVPPGPSTYGNKTGTSMAAPHVAGAFAVLKGANNTATVDELLNAMKDTGVDVTDPRNSLTKPRVDLKAAYDKVITAPRLSKPNNGCFKTSSGLFLCYWNTLTKTTVTFTGHPAAIGESQGDLSHFLWIGSATGGWNHFSGWMTNRSKTVSGLPNSGTIYVRYWTKFSSGWKYQDHTFYMQAFPFTWKPNKELIPKWKPDLGDFIIKEKPKWVPDWCDPRYCDPVPFKNLKEYGGKGATDLQGLR